MARIIRNAQPAPLTKADRARQRIAIMRHDERIASARAKERIARLAYCCAILALCVALFYSI